MNPQMWKHPSTQKNLAYLKEIGYRTIGPAEGDTACDHVGVGRMSEPDEIFETLQAFLTEKKKS